MALPLAFIEDMRQILPADELEDFLHALTQGEQPTSIRINQQKVDKISDTIYPDYTNIPWCTTGRYLPERPTFTLDPLFHAGAYYVQEASSQFVTHAIRHILSSSSFPLTCLDLCAAPGGKSTAALSVLPSGSVLISNEIDRKRARILAENIQKWGNPNVCVTANAPSDFRSLKEVFDLIITDVPCSGEGMFRKDAGSIAEWNSSKVKECAALQKQIVTDIWPCLKSGGYLIYSTCTFNIHEDEENLQFIHDELGGEIIPIPIDKDWNIHPAIVDPHMKDIHGNSACRFMPHFTEGEGLFMALIHKRGTIAQQPIKTQPTKNNGKSSEIPTPLKQWIDPELDCSILQNKDGVFCAISQSLLPLYRQLIQNKLYLLSAGIEMGVLKGKDLQPAHPLALSTALNRSVFHEVDLNLETSLNYLRREAIVLPPDTPRGYILLTYQHLPIGFVKNIGNRCNSLYPTEWRIRNL